MLDNESKYLIYAIVNGLNGQIIEKPDFEMNWTRFFSLSRKNEIFSLVNTVVPKEYLPSDMVEKFNRYTKSEMVRIIAMNQELSKIEEQLNERNVRYMLLKGSIIRDLYPKQVMRQMTDVDILYDIDKRSDIFDIMKSLDYDDPDFSGNSDDFHKEPYYTFEFHNKLFKDVFGFCPDFSYIWDNAIKIDGYDSKYRMSDDDFYLHHITHMYKHYYLGGFGIRFLIDTYLLLTKCQLNDEYISKKLEEFGISEFEAYIKKLSLDMFSNSLDDEQLEYMRTIILDGVFGLPGCDNSKAIEEVYNRFSKENGSSSVLRYALKRIFISKSKLISLYPEIEGKNYLVPIYYIKRFLTKGFGGFHRIIVEVKSILKLKNKKDIEEK